ncbi:MAG: DUF58 domain-containing protein [Anaerolineae bacterium]|nr:DUF58 domain-containing protein [Anaerolineae bacterium]
MFSDAWLLLGLMMVGLGAWFRQPNLLVLGLLLLVIVPVAWAWNKLVLRALHYERHLDNSRVFAGETTGLSLTTVNKKPLPVPWLSIDDAFPPGLEVVERELTAVAGGERFTLSNVMSLRWYEKVVRQYTVRCPRRGFYFLGPADLRAGDLFGLFENRARVSTPDRLIVYPRVVPLEELGFPGKEPFGEAKARQPIFQDPLRTVGVRDYQPADSFRHVHWKASARQQRLQTKVYEPTITQRLVLFLNIATYAQPWMGIDPDRQEHAISVAASIAFHASQRRYAVGLVANGSVPRSDQPIRVMPSRDPGALTRVLEALAAVTTFATEYVEYLLARESPRLPWGATLVVITSVVTPGLVAEMLRLRAASRRMVLVSLDPDFKDDDLPGVVVYHLPPAQLVYGRQEPVLDPDALFRRPRTEDGGRKTEATAR